MSRDISPEISTLRLFLTEPHNCSYLPNQQATTAFVDPAVPLSLELYDRLTNLGFRRSGKYLYIPRCQNCAACLPTRVPVVKFCPTRQQKRCLKANADIQVNMVKGADELEHFPLYQKYINLRHSDGDMYPPSIDQYLDFIGHQEEYSRVLEFRLDGKLVAATVIDRLSSGISAIYTYFEPDLEKRSLGRLAILKIIEIARREKLDYVYLGYWIKGCRKMRYKAEYRPIEICRHGIWQPLAGNVY